jgi:hypothetical protein
MNTTADNIVADVCIQWCDNNTPEDFRHSQSFTVNVDPISGKSCDANISEILFPSSRSTDYTI